MANIGRITVTTDWQKVEDLVENFAPQTDSKYEIQNVGSEDVQIYEGATAPMEERDGFIVLPLKNATWTKETGIYLWVRAKYKATTINIGTL